MNRLVYTAANNFLLFLSDSLKSNLIHYMGLCRRGRQFLLKIFSYASSRMLSAEVMAVLLNQRNIIKNKTISFNSGIILIYLGVSSKERSSLN